MNMEGNRTPADSDAVIIDGVGHYPILQRPDEFIPLLAEILGRLCAM
jgi:pimeloyl-ACP methyl ester carboxylesterase